MAKSFDTSLQNVAAAYLKLLKTEITATTIKKNIEEHPDYPSILSLSDCFRRFNIPNEALELSETYIDQVPVPFVAYVKMPSTGKDFILVRHIDDNRVIYSYKSNGSKTMKRNDFFKFYQNIVWLAQPEATVTEESYQENLKKEIAKKTNMYLWAGGIVLLFILAFWLNEGNQILITYSLIVAIKLSGVGISVLLLEYQINRNNTFIKSLCRSEAKSNCDAILGSKASKIFGISWSEIGFFYFSASLLLLLFPGLPYNDKIIIIAVANSLAAPYILFSIFYQVRIAKQFCPLCLAIQALLILELLWSVIYFWRRIPAFSPNVTVIIASIICLLLPVVAWFGLKPFFRRAQDADLYRAAYKRLQNNQVIFNSLLRSQPMAAEGWQKLGISLGSNIPSITIIKVCNPYCGPCAKAHPELEGLLKSNINLQVKIIFTTSTLQNNPVNLIAKHMLAIANKGNVRKTKQALNDWYLAKNKNYEVFAAKYPVDEETLRHQDEMIKLMGNWCTQSEIQYTPTIFINGHHLPENYSLADLKNIL